MMLAARRLRRPLFSKLLIYKGSRAAANKCWRATCVQVTVFTIIFSLFRAP